MNLNVRLSGLLGLFVALWSGQFSQAGVVQLFPQAKVLQTCMLALETSVPSDLKSHVGRDEVLNRALVVPTQKISASDFSRIAGEEDLSGPARVIHLTIVADESRRIVPSELSDSATIQLRSILNGYNARETEVFSQLTGHPLSKSVSIVTLRARLNPNQEGMPVFGLALGGYYYVLRLERWVDAPNSFAGGSLRQRQPVYASGGRVSSQSLDGQGGTFIASLIGRFSWTPDGLADVQFLGRRYEPFTKLLRTAISGTWEIEDNVIILRLVRPYFDEPLWPRVGV